MTGQQLKNSILQFAIQGKLVPQDPNDEPASELLKRIRKEKEQLVKAGKLKKKDLEVVPIADDEKEFEIPDNWVWVRLSELMQVKGGKRIPLGKSWQDTPTKHIYIRVTDMKNGTIIDDSLRYITEEVFEQIKAYTISKEDLYITVAGTIGSVGIVPEKFDGMNLTENADKLTNVKIDKGFAVKCFSSPFIQNQFKSLTKQMAQPKLSIRNIQSLLIPLPPLAEQKRIVAKIEELLPLVEEYGNAQEELNKLNASLPEKLRQSILQEAIMGKLVPQDPNDEPASKLLERIQEEKKRLVKEGKLKKKDLEVTPITDEDVLFDIPENWIWCKLNDLCVFLSRGRSPKYSETNSGYPVFAQKCNLKQGGISLEQARFLDPSTLDKWADVYKLISGDVLVNSTGTGTVGRTRLFNESCLGNYPFVVPDSHVSVVRTSDAVLSEYIYSLLSSKLMQTYMEDRLAGSTNQKELYISTLQNLPVPLPPLAEQHRIIAKLEEILPKLNELK